MSQYSKTVALTSCSMLLTLAALSSHKLVIHHIIVPNYSPARNRASPQLQDLVRIRTRSTRALFVGSRCGSDRPGSGRTGRWRLGAGEVVGVRHFVDRKARGKKVDGEDVTVLSLGGSRQMSE